MSAAGPPHGVNCAPSGGSAAESAASVGANQLPALLLMGPTASGKSALALALARRTAAEIVSVDSAQVYRGMDIGTAKPDRATRAEIPHHLIDVVEPTESYSAARFRADAIRAIAAIRSRGAMPIVVGGTMLYFKALTEGLSALPAADPILRAEISARAAATGWPALHAELARMDPRTAARLEPTDAQRIQRALEVCVLAGRPLSELHGAREARDGLGASIAVAIIPGDRGALHARIAQRFEAMLEAGLVAELADLRARHALTRDLSSMRCVGYRQAWEFLDGDIDALGLRARGIAATRQLAKRQYTWLRATRATVFDSAQPGLVDAVCAFLARERVIPA